MKNKFKIRVAKKEDAERLLPLMLQAIMRDKSIDVTEDFHYHGIHSFLDASIAYEQIILIEDNENKVRMMGEVHRYNISSNTGSFCKEYNFFPAQSSENEEELVQWLYSEIENKHKDVFSVEVQTSCKELAADWKNRGLVYPLSTNYCESDVSPVQQFYWINPSFN